VAVASHGGCTLIECIEIDGVARSGDFGTWQIRDALTDVHNSGDVVRDLRERHAPLAGNRAML
jgi:hypothetical protein